MRRTRPCQYTYSEVFLGIHVRSLFRVAFSSRVAKKEEDAPTSSRRPFPKIPSTASNEKNPTQAALEFILSAFSTNPNVAGSIVGMTGGGGTPGGELIAFAVLAASFLLFSSIAALMDSNGPARGVKTTPREEEDAVREDARRAAVKVRVVGVVVVSGVRRTCIVKLERGKVPR